MKTKFILIKLFLFSVLVSSNSVFAQTLTSCTVIFVTPDCDGCDNKDHDTRIRVSVFGAYGSEVASTYYTDNKEFPDNGSENAVPCTITSNQNGAGAFAQKIWVSIEPNGNDDWVFEARVIFNLSHGSTIVSNMRGRAQVSRGNPTVELWNQ